MTASLTGQSTKKYKIDSSIKIETGISSGTFSFTEIFHGFDKLDAVKEIFGPNTFEILSKLKVEVFPRNGFMGVSDEDGHIFASRQYINQGERWSVYLDAVHELVHVRQFMEGKNLFDPAFAYVDRPTEVEAYRVGAKEARRIGLSDEEIFDYLKVPWITKSEHVRLARACDVPTDLIVPSKKVVKKKK
ncbi:MAG: hypothetical protein ACYCQJ_09220 [Nitrososphaerales archaeon]